MNSSRPGLQYAHPLPYKGDADRPLHVARIIEVTARHYGLTQATLVGRARHANVAYARHVAMFLSRILVLRASFPSIALEFNRDHTTVMAACDRIKHLCLTDKAVAADVAVLRNKLAAELPPQVAVITASFSEQLADLAKTTALDVHEVALAAG